MLLFQSAGAAVLDPPAVDTLAEGRRIVQEMIRSQRGPYSRILWFCNDGSTQPPVAFACAELGGGRQHAQYSPARDRLAELGWSVGTIFASMTYEELADDENRQQRLRQIPLENYMFDVDDGWVLRGARHYRGRIQVEDEEAAGKSLLLRLLADAKWVDENFLLLREAARSIPHGDDSDFARAVRRKAIQLAEIEPAAEKWRVEIHTNPSARTAGRLKKWAERQPAPEVRELALSLADDLDTLYGAAGRHSRIVSALDALGVGAASDHIRSAVLASLDRPAFERIETICSAAWLARHAFLEDFTAPQRLALLDAMRELETETMLAYQEIKAVSELPRVEILGLSRSLLQCSYAAGLLSDGELKSVSESLYFDDDVVISLERYRNAIMRVKRAPGWAIGTVRHTFAEALVRYTALDARAARFSDDLLRGSSMWMLGDTLKILSKDVDALSGSVVEFDGTSVGAAVALNSGIARGTLRIFDTLAALEGATLDRNDIAVIPETIAELTPVAGILTLGEGNALSHVQLLARNFGIPNVAVDFDSIDMLRPLAGQRVLLVVTSDGNVLLQADAADATPANAPTSAGITVPVPDLGFQRLLTLDDIGREMSGRVVGPKAANLGELNRMFPGRVAPAVAIPFGIYAAHLEEAGLRRRIGSAFSSREGSSLQSPVFDTEIAAIRDEVSRLQLSAELQAELVALMREQFGEPETYGVFVRSDTNVEDLPQFTGAGLNETIPNLVQLDAQINAVPRVWSSVLSPRALAWRSSVLANPEQIYASVLLMKSVPATKSGVLVTRNLFDRNKPGLTASVAWGVGGAVAGEAAETVVILDDEMEVVSEAKSPYQRHIAPGGGVDWVAAPAGRVLTADEVDVLRALAAEVNDRYVAVFDDHGVARPWDIEFGFVEGELTLFQIRPLVERGTGSADALLRQLRPATADPVPVLTRIRIDQAPSR